MKGTHDLWLTYSNSVKELEGYADADGSMAEDRKAISGYTFLVNGGAVSWSVKRQEIISLSTTESKYVAAIHAAKEALWLCSLILSLFGIDIPTTTTLSGGQARPGQGHFCWPLTLALGHSGHHLESTV